MNRRKRKFLIRSLGTLILLLITAGIFYFSSLDRAIRFLSFNKPVEADFLIVEGWVGENALLKAVEEFEKGGYSRMITTGSVIDSYYLMSTEGLLEYHFTEHPVQLDPGDTVDVCLKGTPVHGIYPEFTLFINDQEISRHISSGDWNLYSFVFDTGMVVHRVGITFDNDEVYFEQDRNLYVGSVRLKGSTYPARSRYSFHYRKNDPLKLDPAPTDFHSLAAICARELRHLGVPEDQIIILESPQSDQNRTLTSALVVEHWIQSNGFEDSAVNVLSESIHSRRTHMLYRYALKKHCREVGIVSVLPEDNRYLGNRIDRKDIIREFTGNLYYRFLFNKRKFRREFFSPE